MATFSLTIPLGIGDAIFVASSLNAIKHHYEAIYINIHPGLAQAFKDNAQYDDFYLELVKILFSDPKFVINDRTKVCPYVPTEELFNNVIIPVLPRFYDRLTSTDIPSIEGEYIVVTTKVRQLTSTIYQAVKPRFLASLEQLSKKYKIVILGEKLTEMNTEYRQYGAQYIYNIYQDLVGISNVIDLTVPKLGITSPEIGQLKKDCGIMRGAKNIITFGCGGNFILATAVAQRLIAYRIDDYEFVDRMFQGQTDLITTNNSDKFIALLLQL
jgi:hypothetical protein